MKPSILVDTGALVAFGCQTDRYHSWAVEQFRQLHPPLYTCEAVLSETCFLMSDSPKAIDLLFQSLESNIIQIQFKIMDELKNIHQLIQRYHNLPMSFADACLVRMSEIFDQAVIMTFDGDFKIYRRHGRTIIPLLFPEF